MPIISNDVTQVTWSTTSSIFRNVYPGITVKPSENTEYTVSVSNPGGCKASDRVNVFVLCNGGNVFIPNTFSPNGDGNNEVFYPRGTGLFQIKSFRIFNRWGELMFEKKGFAANDASNGWDGTYKGVKLNPDVFVYTIEIFCDNGSMLTFKGNIALIK
jgi:gliding motility-associated-like protein